MKLIMQKLKTNVKYEYWSIWQPNMRPVASLESEKGESRTPAVWMSSVWKYQASCQSYTYWGIIPCHTVSMSLRRNCTTIITANIRQFHILHVVWKQCEFHIFHNVITFWLHSSWFHCVLYVLCFDDSELKLIVFVVQLRLFWELCIVA